MCQQSHLWRIENLIPLSRLVPTGTSLGAFAAGSRFFAAVTIHIQFLCRRVAAHGSLSVPCRCYHQLYAAYLLLPILEYLSTARRSSRQCPNSINEEARRAHQDHGHTQPALATGSPLSRLHINLAVGGSQSAGSTPLTSGGRASTR